MVSCCLRVAIHKLYVYTVLLFLKCTDAESIHLWVLKSTLTCLIS